MNPVRSVLLLARSAFFVGATVAAAVVVAMLLGVKLPNPMGTTHVDRDHTAMVQKLRDVSRYTAASEHLQVIVDSEDRADLLPKALKGERVVFVAEGDVGASVDFSQLADSGMEVSADGKSVTVHLPEPELDQPHLDPSKSSVVSRERGLIDRVGDAVSGVSTINDQKLYESAQDKMADAAAKSELQSKARSNTERFVTSLFTSAGYEHVTVLFDRPPAAASA